MTDQLLLIDSRPVWRLDRTTRAKGLEGVARARTVLRDADARRRAAEQADLPTPASPASPSADQPALPLPDAA